MHVANTSRVVRTVLLLGLLWVLTPLDARASPVVFSDSFEGSIFDPFWTVVQQFGTVSPTSVQAQSGTQSAGFASASGGQRELHLQHTFGSQLIGDVSAWYFDNAPGSETLYQQLALSSSIGPMSVRVGTFDFDAACYVAGVSFDASNFGPSASCSGPSYLFRTDVARTAGWHLLGISVEATGIEVSIDNALVFSLAGSFSFDTIDLLMSGPAARPNTIAYFDDVSVNATTLDAVPEPSTVVMVVSGLLLAARIRRRRSTGH